MRWKRKTRWLNKLFARLVLLTRKLCVRPSRGQVDDLIAELCKLIEKGERALVTTLTKRMAEDMSAYLKRDLA